MTPAGWISKKLWELTYWDKRFNGVDKSKQKKILPFKHVSAEKLKSICVRGGKIKLLATGKFDGYTTKDLAQDDVNCGEVLTLPSGGTAAIKYFNGTFVDSGNIIAQTSDAEQYCLKFIYYYLMCINNVIAKEYRGTSIKHPYMPAILELSIPVPSLSEQQQIVEKLDALFADIEKEKQIAQQNLQNAKELFESELNKIVIKNDTNWTKKKLNDVCVVERGSSPRPIKNFVTTDENGVNWIRIGDCSEKYVNSTSQKITPDGAKKSRFVNVGDFIISNSMSYGKPYILNINGCIHDGWFVLRLDKTLVDTDYFYYLLSSPFVKEQYDSLATGAIVQNISSDLIKKVQFCLPPLSEQQTIVQQINVLHKQTQELEQIYTKQIADLDELKQAILKKAFNGEL